MHTLQIDVVGHVLPGGFDSLRLDAQAEGYQFLDRLATEWAACTTRFDRPFEVLLAAQLIGTLAGIGGLTLDAAVPGALRMRRFYIRPAFRRRGVGQTLATTLLGRAGLANRPVTVNAGTADAAAFWEALGFTAEVQDGHTHIKARCLARVPPAG